MFVDSHCHLSFPELHERIDAVRSAMQEARVDRALCICTTLEEFPVVHALATRYDNFWASVGVHPDNEGVREPSVDDLLSFAAQAARGRDRRNRSRLLPPERPQRRAHGVAARALSGAHPRRAAQRPAAGGAYAQRQRRHDRAAARGGRGDRCGGVFHCFTETEQVADAALELGFHISFSGILTFKNAEALRDVARRVPLERCLIETDSPYLAPVPYRGKTNQPAYVPHVANALAQAKGLTLTEVARATTHNFEQLFAIPPLSSRPDKHENIV